jgi:hypothetical protein
MSFLLYQLAKNPEKQEKLRMFFVTILGLKFIVKILA